MSSWHEEYIQNLNLRDKREKRDYELIDACSYYLKLFRVVCTDSD
jgi:hypothetical protein